MIHCVDAADRKTVEEADANASQFNEVAREWRRVPRQLHMHVLPRFDRSSGRDHRAGAGPIVVCGTTGDPATPLASTRRWPNPRGRPPRSSSKPTRTRAQRRPVRNELIDDYLVNLGAPAKSPSADPRQSRSPLGISAWWTLVVAGAVVVGRHPPV